jgi:hypothetical protein
MKRMIFRPEQALDVQVPAACNQRSISVEERGKAGECCDDPGLVARHGRRYVVRACISFVQGQSP